MKRKVLALAGVALVVVAAVGVAWGLWMASSVIHTSLQVSSPTAVKITNAVTDDDGVVFTLYWDPNDTGPDPAALGPKAVRYGKDIANCQASVNNPKDTEGHLVILRAYGGSYCTSWWQLANSSVDQPWTLAEVTVALTPFKNCPTLTSVDIDGDGAMDVEGCLAEMEQYNPVVMALLGVTWTPSDVHWALVSLHVLDTATPGKTHSFDVSFNGPAQVRP